MKVIYTSVMNMIVEAVCKADEQMRKIERIELDTWETQRLLEELNPELRFACAHMQPAGQMLIHGVRVKLDMDGRRAWAKSLGEENE